MDLDKWQFNIDKFETITNGDTRELIKDMFDRMISNYQESHHSGSKKGNDPWQKTAMLCFNTLLSNGYLISEREKTLAEVLD